MTKWLPELRRRQALAAAGRGVRGGEAAQREKGEEEEAHEQQVLTRNLTVGSATAGEGWRRRNQSGARRPWGKKSRTKAMIAGLLGRFLRRGGRAGDGGVDGGVG